MNSTKNLRVSLVIPMKNEGDSITELISSVEQQTFQPDEVVLVDGGSTDNTIELVESFALKNSRIKIIKTPQASPGKGRNIGIENSLNDWIALTDAGIFLDKNWLLNLCEIAVKDTNVEVVFGNVLPITDSMFEKCSAVAHVPPKNERGMRGKSIASCLLKKNVWSTIGGFPDLRAAEDLIFIEKIDVLDFRVAYAPKAIIYWKLRRNLLETFRKFTLYSKYNVWAGKQKSWHYGLAKQYLLVFPFLLLAFFFSYWWLVFVGGWFLARITKKLLSYRREFKFKVLFNPLFTITLSLIILTIDLASLVGFLQAYFGSPSKFITHRDHN
jgi:glycosyltransferase involved in cell wall biosynthesis